MNFQIKQYDLSLNALVSWLRKNVGKGYPSGYAGKGWVITKSWTAYYITISDGSLAAQFKLMFSEIIYFQEEKNV